MISGGNEIKKFAKIRLTLQVMFGEDPYWYWNPELIC